MKITVPTVNAKYAKHKDNCRIIEETLNGVSWSPESYVVIHPYSITGVMGVQDAHLWGQFCTTAGVKIPNKISLVWADNDWALHYGEADQMLSLSNGYVTYHNLNLTTCGKLRSQYQSCLEASGDVWVIFLMDAYAKEDVLERIHLAKMLYEKSSKPVLLVGALGLYNDLLFAGELALFHGEQWGYGFALGNQVTQLEVSTTHTDLEWQGGATQYDFLSGETASHYALITFAIREFVVQSGFKRVHLGLSGGVDSALVATLAVHALGKENVVGILMPSPHSSTHSVDDALALASNLGIETQTIPINEPYQSLQELLGTHFELTVLADENMQARLRGLYLMTYANSSGSFLLTTGNKSEIACGYGTLYGDMCGSYNPIGDLYKTDVYAMCDYINSEAGYELIPNHILTKAPSAELREGQYDQESLPPYDRLDMIIELLLLGQNDYEVIAEQVESSVPEVKQVVGLLRRSEFKRWQAPPVLKLSATHLGSSRPVRLLV